MILRIISMSLGSIGVYLILFQLPLPNSALKKLLKATAVSDFINIIMTFCTLFWRELSLTDNLFDEIQEYFIYVSLVIPASILYLQYEIVVKDRAINSIKIVPTLLACLLGAGCISLINLPNYMHLLDSHPDVVAKYEVFKSCCWIIFFLVLVVVYLKTTMVLRLNRRILHYRSNSATLVLMENLASALTVTNIFVMIPLIILLVAHSVTLYNPDNKIACYIIAYISLVCISAHLIKGFFHALAVIYCRFRYDQAVGRDLNINFIQKLYRSVLGGGGGGEDDGSLSMSGKSTTLFVGKPYHDQEYKPAVGKESPSDTESTTSSFSEIDDAPSCESIPKLSLAANVNHLFDRDRLDGVSAASAGSYNSTHMHTVPI